MNVIRLALILVVACVLAPAAATVSGKVTAGKGGNSNITCRCCAACIPRCRLTWWSLRMHFADGAFLNAVSEAGLASIIVHVGPPLNKSAEMPSYGTTLAKPQIETLIAYIRPVAIRCIGLRV